MQSNRHERFILSPIISILQDAVNASAGIGDGVETQSLGEYVLQTTFLKMTGASEQKLKCICWEMATNDYEYRHDYMRKNYGECSSYDAKNGIYKDLIERIQRLDSSFSVDMLFDDIDITSRVKAQIENRIRKEIKKQVANKGRELTEEETNRLSDSIEARYAVNGLPDIEKARLCRTIEFESIQDSIVGIIGHSLLAQWEQHNYQNYTLLWKSMSDRYYAEGDALLCKDLQVFYSEYVYDHRNRCAHNLMSFQNNLPTLKALAEDGFIFNNYYFRFSMLVLLDEVFVRLYKRYSEALGAYGI